MSAGIIVSASGLPQFEAVLAKLAAKAADRSPLFDRIGAYMETSTDLNFERERAPDGQRWVPSLRAKEEGGKTLTNTARLRQSMTHNASDDQVEVGTNVIYAGVHQGGATIRGKNGPLKFKLPGLGFRSAKQVTIPARPFLGVSADDEIEIVALGEDYLAEAIPDGAA
jgi:phage virion morphogenesis protein